MQPLQVENETFHNVMRLYSKVRALQIRERREAENPRKQADVIRRPAGDNWF